MSAAKWLELPRRSSIYVAGDPADFIYVVISGIVMCSQILPDGRRQVVAFLFAGDVLGVAFDKNLELLNTAETVTDTELCRFPRAPFETLMRSNADLAHEFLRTVSNELIEAQEHIVVLGRMSARERVAWFLALLLDRARRADAAASSVQLPMQRVDIADYLGLTVETVSRAMAGLRREGIIGLPDAHKVQLLDVERLSEAAAA